MEKQQLLKLVNKYIEGGCTPDEELLLEKYLDFLNKGGGEWNEERMGDKKAAGEKIYSQVLQLIKEKEISVARRSIFTPSILKIAASIIFFLAISAGALYISGIFNNNTAAWIERKTVPGEKLVLRLADSSEIILNADSKLKYPSSFQGTTREVYLEGEAYFKIKHDKTKPFIVHAANLLTTVLGTKFNISAFPGEKNIAVSLVEGSVKVSQMKSDNIISSSVLHPDEKLVYNTEKAESKIEKFDIVEETGWKDNLLKFNDETLKNVFVRLERAYGVKFELMPRKFESYLITTNFQKASLSTISEAIKKQTGLNYTTIKENDQIKKIIFKKK